MRRGPSVNDALNQALLGIRIRFFTAISAFLAKEFLFLRMSIFRQEDVNFSGIRKIKKYSINIFR
jgi:hypothetical protein